MSLVAVWVHGEDPPRLWMASDSRLTGPEGTLLNEGVKIFEVPVVCRREGASGDLDDLYFATRLGLGCVGGSLIYQQVHATLVPLLSNLIGISAPSMEDIARFTAAIGTQYVRSLGIRQPLAAMQVQLVLGGFCPRERALVAFELRPEEVADRIDVTVRRIDLSEPYFAGNQVEGARGLYEQISVVEQPVSAERAPLRVIRQMIDDADAPTIGGDVQVGFTLGAGFRRVLTFRPIPGQEPRAARWLNAICVDDLPSPGPCSLGLMGSVTP